ncbi:hypothetical protein GGR70_002096 [Xanthomonas campestris]|nr:hypothetical protein [Xanthomonas campestris]
MTSTPAVVFHGNWQDLHGIEGDGGDLVLVAGITQQEGSA